MTNSLFFSSVSLTFIRACGVGVQALSIVFIARSLPIAEVGAYAITYALLNVIRFIGPLGTDQTILRTLSSKTEPDDNERQALADASLVITFGSGAVFALILLLYLLVGVAGLEVEPGSGLAIFLCCILYSTMGSLIAQIRGMGYNIRAQMPEALLTHIVFGVLIVLGQWAGLLSYSYLLIALASSLACTVFSYLTFRTMLGFKGFQLPDLAFVLTSIRQAHSSFLAILFTIVSGRVPIMAASTLGGAPAGAILDMSLRFGSMASLTTNSVGATFSPRFASQAKQGDVHELKHTLLMACLVAGIPAWIWVIVLLLGAPYAIGSILPETYRSSLWPMVVVALAFGINAALGPSTNFLYMSGKARVVAFLSAAQLIILFGASVIFFNHFGVLGISFALAVGSVIRDGGCMLYSLILLNGQERVR